MPAGIESAAPGSMSSTWRVPAAVPSLAQSSSPLRPSFIAKYTEPLKRTRPLGNAPRKPGLTTSEPLDRAGRLREAEERRLIDGWYATKSRRSPRAVSSRGSASSAAIEAIEVDDASVRRLVRGRGSGGHRRDDRRPDREVQQCP